MTTVTGILRDAQQNAIPNAGVTVRYTRALVGFDGGAVAQNDRLFTTDGSGELVMTGLIPGYYEVSVFMPTNANTTETVIKRGTGTVPTGEASISWEAFLQEPIGTVDSTVLQQAIAAKGDAELAAAAAEAAAASVEFPVSYAPQSLNTGQQAQARENIGLGTIATQDAGDVAITGGTVDGAAITGLADGVEPDDAATVGQVNAVADDIPPELTLEQVTDPDDETFGTVSGQRLAAAGLSGGTLAIGEKDVSEISSDGIFSIEPSDGARITLTGHGGQDYVIKGFGDQCPVGWVVTLVIPQTIPNVGNGTNDLGLSITFVDYRDYSVGAAQGFDIEGYSFFNGVKHRSYVAYPDATDAQGNIAALKEEITFVHLGDGIWTITDFPQSRRGENARGWWQKHYDGAASAGFSNLYPTDIDIVQEAGFRSDDMEEPTPILFQDDGKFTGSVSTLNANTWGGAGVSFDPQVGWRWRGMGNVSRTEVDMCGTAAGSWKPSPWTGNLVAHRGNNTLSDPENVIGSLDNLSPWVTGVEIDVRATSDGVAVLMHDATINRTTSGTGAVNNISLSALQALDAGTEAGGGETVPTLAEYLAACEGRGFEIIFIDMKEYGIPLYTQVAQIVAASNVADACIIKLENGTLAAMQAQAAAIRAESATVKIGRLSLQASDVDDIVSVFDEYSGFVAITRTHANFLTDRLTFGKVKDAGYLYGCSTQNDMDRLAQCKRDNCYIIFTDIAGDLEAMFG